MQESVAAYIRVSTEEQRVKGLSLEAQKLALEQWAKANGCRITKFYEDAGISARKRYDRRPAMIELLTDVRAGAVERIIFTKLDRWFRNIAEYYKVQEILEAHNVQWKTIHEDYDTSTASGRFKINIMLSVAQDEADRDSERIKAVFDSKKERLEPLTGNVPLGYKIENKKVVKDPETQEAVAFFFARYLALRSISTAREETNQRYGTHISYQMADAMLRKEAYYGAFNGVPGMSPQYITPEQHEAIVAGRRDVSRRTKNGRVYLFSGLIRCGECGSRMTGRTHQFPRNAKVHTEKAEYNCPGHYLRNICSSRINIAEREIEGYLLDHIEEAFRRYALETERLANGQEKDYSSDIAKAKRKLSRLKELYINDLIELEAYKRDYTGLMVELARLEEKQKALERPKNLAALREALCPGWQRIYGDMTREEKKEFWVRVIQTVQVFPDRHIEFSFSN